MSDTLLSDLEAEDITNHFDSLPPDQQPVARNRLRAYFDEKDRRRAEAFRSVESLMLDAPEDFAKSNPAAVKPLMQPDDWDETRELAGLSTLTGADPRRISKAPGAFRAAVADSWGQPDIATDVPKFRARLKAHFQKSRDTRLLGEDIDTEATRAELIRDAALTPEMITANASDIPSWEKWSFTAPGKPGFDQSQTGAYFAKWAAAQERVRKLTAPLRGQINEAWTTLSDPNAGEVLGLADVLSQMPAKDRRTVLWAIQQRAEAMPEAQKKQFWDRAGRAFMSSLVQMLTGMATGPERIGDMVFRDFGASPEDRAQLRKRQDTLEELRSLQTSKLQPFESSDDGLLAKVGLGAMQSAPSLAAAFAGPVGWYGIGAQMTDESRAAVRPALEKALQAQGLDADQADERAGVIAEPLAIAAGAINTAVEKLTFGIATGIPGVRGLQAKLITATSESLAKRIALRGAAFALEAGELQLQEAVQDAMPFALADAAKVAGVDLPDFVNEDGSKSRWITEAGRVFGKTALDPTTLGVSMLFAAGGFGHVDGVTLAEGLRREGVESSAIEQVLSAAPEQRAAAAIAAIEAVPPEAKAAAKEAAAAQDAAAKAAGVLGVLPTFRVNPDGIGVFLDGQHIGTAPTVDEAMQVAAVASEQFADMDADQTALLASMLETADVFATQEDVGKVAYTEVSPNKRTVAQQLAESAATGDVTTEARLREEIRLMAEAEGVDPDTLSLIAGDNVTTFQNRVAYSVSRVFEGASPLTVVHENAHGSFKAGLRNGTFTREGTIGVVRGVERATGQKFFQSTDDGAIGEAELEETVMQLAEAEVLGRRKRGDALAPGAITKGIAAYIRQEAKAGAKALKEAVSFKHFIGAVRRMMKQVFQRALALRKAQAEGKLGDDYHSFLNKLLGVDSQISHEDAVSEAALDYVPPTPEQEAAGMAFSLAPAAQRDAEYLAAVEAGDMEKAQRMVDEAAKAAGLIELYHGSSANEEVKTFEDRSTSSGALAMGIYMSPDIETAQGYGKTGRYWVNVNLPGFEEYNAGLTLEQIAAGKTTPVEGKSANGAWKIENGTVEVVVRKASQIKSAEPVTRDEAGNVIPLSKRFSSESPAEQEAAGMAFSVGGIKRFSAHRKLKELTAFIKDSGIPYNRHVAATGSAYFLLQKGEKQLRVRIGDHSPTERLSNDLFIDPFAYTFPEGRAIIADYFGLPFPESQQKPKAVAEWRAEFAKREAERAARQPALEQKIADAKAEIARLEAEIPQWKAMGPAYDAIVSEKEASLSAERAFLQQMENQKPAIADGLSEPVGSRLAAGADQNAQDAATPSSYVNPKGGMAFSLANSRAVPADTSRQFVMPDGARLIGPTVFSIKAYHGTPHKVDRFSLDKIGTGEGAQAYGWGLYFAEDRAVGESYKTDLSLTIKVDGNTVLDKNARTRKWTEFGTAEAQAETLLISNRGDIEKAINKAQSSGAFARAVPILEAMRGKVQAETSGNLYTVELLPDESDFLDWDKPLSEQSEKVKAALSELPEWRAASEFQKDRPEQPEQAGIFYFELSKQFSELKAASERLAALGIPGIRYLDGNSRDGGSGTRNFVIFDDKLVKILEENGTPIEQAAPSFALAPAGRLASVEDRVQKALDKDPELKRRVFTDIRSKLARLANDWSNLRWTPKGDRIEPIAEKRSAKSLDKEQAFREAARRSELNDLYAGPIEHQFAGYIHQPELAKLSEHPLIKFLRSNTGGGLFKSRIMSPTQAAIRDLNAGRMDKHGDYDDAGGIPRMMFGGTEAPDTVAQEAFEAGLIKGDTPPALWEGIRSAFREVSKNREDLRYALDKLKEAQKRAKDEAKAEAAQWRKEQDTAQKKDHSPKAAMLRDLVTLDAMLAALPAEVRAKVGGYVAVARLGTDASRLAELQKRADAIGREMEVYLRKFYGDEVQKLFDRAKPSKGGPGEKPIGKVGADVYKLVQAAAGAMSLTPDGTDASLAEIDTLLAADDLSPEAEAMLQRERGLVELFGAWNPVYVASGRLDKIRRPIYVRAYDGADSARRAAAFDSLKTLVEEGLADWTLELTRRKERRQAIRAALSAATGKSGSESERRAKAKEAKTLFGKGLNFLLSISSFEQVAHFAFGEKSTEAQAMVDQERAASNAYEDEMQAVTDDIEALFMEMAGSPLDAEKLRFQLSQRTKDGGKVGEMSEMEIIQAILMWRQEDGQRHMIGKLDEDGKPAGPWNYDQAWVDAITKQLSPEGLRVLDYIAQNYGAEYATLNPLYEQRHGISLPANLNYAPITVAPQQAKAGQMVDPVSGAVVTGSILTPGSLRTRSRSAVAEPEFRDALQVFLAHKRQMAHWKAYYDFAVEAQQVLGNRELGNAVKAAAGDQAKVVLSKWIDAFAQGGSRDAAAGLAATETLQKMTGRAAAAALVGRVSVLMIQSTQLAAAAVEMPVGSYLKRLGKLLSGNLGWGDAIRSEYVQRRMAQQPPIIRQAMESLTSQTNPNRLKHEVARLGRLINGADGLFTAGTYAILLDYHRQNAAKLGMKGAEAEKFAHENAARSTDRVAQPMRMGARSIWEVTSTNPLARLSWAFASEARQKISIVAWSGVNIRTNPKRFAKAVFLAWVVGGVAAEVIRSAYRDLKDDDDEEVFDARNWSPSRLALSALAGPLKGVPGLSAIFETGGNLFSSGQRGMAAAQSLFSGDSFDSDEPVEETLRDVDSILTAMALFNDNAAAIASLAHAGLDGAKLIDSLSDDDVEAGLKQLRKEAADRKQAKGEPSSDQADAAQERKRARIKAAAERAKSN